MCAHPLQEAGKGGEYEALLKDIEGAALEGGALDEACNQLQQLVGGLKVPPQLSKEVGEASVRFTYVAFTVRVDFRDCLL